ncbi:hypothetical protein MMC22_012034 [Lobaria immixta]|nr:hypothetical protein [Lobaria immixta]
MGNLASRETKPMLEDESWKHIATGLGNFLHHRSEREKLRATESSERRRRRIANEEAQERARQTRQGQVFELHHYHHHNEPSNPRGSRRDWGFFAEPPFEAREQHTGRHNSLFIRPRILEPLKLTVPFVSDHLAPSHLQGQQRHHHRSHGRHGRRSHHQSFDPDTNQHLEPQWERDRAASSVTRSRYSSHARYPRAHQPGSGSEREGAPPNRQPRGRRSRPPMQSMQPRGPAASGPPRGRQPPPPMGMGMGPYPQNHPTYMQGVPPEAGDTGAFGAEGDDEGDDEDVEDGMDGPAVGGGGMGAEGMGAFREGFDVEGRMGRGRGRGRDRHEGLGPDQRPE